MRNEGRLTPLKGIAIIMVFSIVALSCIDLAIQGESDLAGTDDNVRAFSITRTGDSRYRLSLLGSTRCLQVSPMFPQVYEKARDALSHFISSVAIYVRQSIGNLGEFKLP